MNHPFVLDRSRALADRSTKSAEPIDERTKWLIQTLYQRAPNELESKLAASHAGNWESFCQALLCTNEFIYVD
jgi:hypothetical protein